MPIVDGGGAVVRVKRPTEVEGWRSEQELTPFLGEERYRSEDDPPVLAVKGLSKSFGGALALSGIDLEVRRGEVHCLVGENGAGKSTLVKILAGAVKPDTGHIELNGNVVNFRSPHDALQQGLAFIFQELGAVPAMTVSQNICLGKEPCRRGRVLDKVRATRESVAVLSRIGFNRIRPDALMGTLSVGDQQGVMIARGLWLDAKIIVMDEPTAALGRSEVERLFSLVRQLAVAGHAVLFISHKLEEIREVGDWVSVFRNGEKVDAMLAEEASDERLLFAMTGRHVSLEESMVLHETVTDVSASSIVLKAEEITTSKIFGVNLSLRVGEILGIGGLVGSGRTDVLHALVGLDKVLTGAVKLNGNDVHFRGPRDALRSGVVLVPEDRRVSGLLPNRSVGQNLLLGYEQLRRKERPVGAARELAAEQITSLQIHPPLLDKPVLELSGGNQQKTVLGRWLLCRPRVLLLDEPTRGVDVGARSEIYRILGQLASVGIAIIMVTSDLRELVQVSDRIVVMRKGRVVGELGRHPEEGDVLALAFSESKSESGWVHSDEH